MLILAKFLAKALKVLNSEVSPRQIAAGFAWGAVIGLIPVKGLMPVALLVLAFVVNINLMIMWVAAAVFKVISFAIDPLANRLGLTLLTLPSLESFWTTLFNTPLVPYTRFNNTIVMGSLAIGILLAVPLYYLGRLGVVWYRESLRERIQKLRLVQILKTSTFFKLYLTFRKFTGNG